jgi:HD-GYP domain-containing protein (c-di-GMP phosphodiesterase class II)
MLVYLPVPLERVQLGAAFPVDVWSPDGRLLLRRGQVLQSTAHRDMLASHQACMTETDAQAWQKSLERAMRQQRARGVEMAQIANTHMPSEILDSDYLEGRAVDGGWLDLQEILRGLLYQGADANAPLARLEGIELKALSLLAGDPDDSLFVLFQALPELSLGYCATHALLSGAVAALTANKLSLPNDSQALLLRSALVMNIGMARPQDTLARQQRPPNAQQKQLIELHAPTSVEILRGFGTADDALFDMVHWHHLPDLLAGKEAAVAIDNLHLLNLADVLVAKMSPRTSRAAMTSVGVAKWLLMQNSPSTAVLRPAMASVLGFYPPGTYVQLQNGEIAVVIQRGLRANTPHVASIMNANGMALSKYVYRDTGAAGNPLFAVRAPLPSSAVHIRVSLEKVRRMRQQHGISP